MRVLERKNSRLAASVFFLFAAVAAVAAIAGAARADGRFDGKWSFSGVSEGYTVQQWFKSCGPPPVGGNSGGGTVNVVTDGDELVIMAGRTFRTNQCWDPMPTLTREAHSRDAAGGAWRTRCVTPAGDPRRASVNTSVTALSDNRILIQETGRYEIAVAEGTCVALVNRSGTLNRIVDPTAASASASAPSATATIPAPPAYTAPPAPTPTVDCSSPGDPARLEVRPSRKLIRAGESYVFKATVADANGCPTNTQTTWAVDKATAIQPTIDAAGKVSVPADAEEGSFDVVVTAAGKSTRVTVEVASPADYDGLLAQSGLNSNGEEDKPAVAIIATGSLGGAATHGEDGSKRRRLVFIAIIAAVSVLLGIVALIGVRRSRKAKAIERDATEKHAERVHDFEMRRRDREAHHAAQMQAHLESVRKAQELAAAGAAPHPGEMVCPSCRKEYPPGSTFCPQDANRLIPLSGHEDVLTGPAGGICPTCKRGFNPGIKSCPFDNDELVPFSIGGAAATNRAAMAAPKGKICPTCGGRFDGAAGFCGKDGTALVLLN